jgi:transcriptional regulator
MPRRATDSVLLPGTLDLLILQTLSLGDLHGYAIAQRIKQRSDEVLQIEEGSLYPALQRLELKGYITSEWQPAGPKRRVRVYQLTKEGKAQLSMEVTAFESLVQAVRQVLRPA